MFIILRNASSQSECVDYILLFQMKLKPLPMGYLCGCFVNIPDSLYKAKIYKVFGFVSLWMFLLHFMSLKTGWPDVTGMQLHRL